MPELSFGSRSKYISIFKKYRATKVTTLNLSLLGAENDLGTDMT